jgi:hypothetical protein
MESEGSQMEGGEINGMREGARKGDKRFRCDQNM